MPKQLSFIHAADLHLDSPFQGLASAPEHIFHEIQMSTFTALDQLVQVAIEKNVDFVLLVGDLFDNESQSLKAQIRLRQAFERLALVNIPVYLSYGNHDYLEGNIHSVTYPDNVFIFPSEEVSYFTYNKNEEPLANIYGFSYERRAITENKAREFTIENTSIPFHIATLHGSIKNNIEHDVYAPFQISDLLHEDFHYWALGHIHKRKILRNEPLVVYPGNTQGRHRKETGEKGCYYVTLTEAEEEMTFIPLQAIEFTSLTIDLSTCHDIFEVEKSIRSMLGNIETASPILIELTLKNTIHLQNVSKQNINDLIDVIHETTTEQRNWRYIFSVSLKNMNTSTTPYVGDHFIGQLAEQFDEVQVEQIIQKLYKHRHARKFLQPLNEDEKQYIKDEAEQLLFSKLLHKE